MASGESRYLAARRQGINPQAESSGSLKAARKTLSCFPNAPSAGQATASRKLWERASAKISASPNLVLTSRTEGGLQLTKFDKIISFIDKIRKMLFLYEYSRGLQEQSHNQEDLWPVPAKCSLPPKAYAGNKNR